MLLASLVICGGCGAAAPSGRRLAAGSVVPATVAYVIDGDTIAVTFGDGTEESVRFIGVDTPERTGPVEPYGLEAEAYTREALDGAAVYLETDARLRDRHGRLLAYVWTEDPAGEAVPVADGMFNARLLANGYAALLTIPPNVKYAETFVELERRARADGAGLWGLEGEP